MGSCVDSSDCLIESGEGDIVRVCYEEMFGSDEEFFCDCSGVYGFVGDRCEDQSIQSIFLGVVAIITGIVTLGGIFFSVVLLIQRRENLFKLFKCSPMPAAERLLTILALMLFFDFLSDFGRSVTELILFANPDKVTLFEIKTLFVGNNSDNTFPIVSTPTPLVSVFHIQFSFLYNGLITLGVLFSWLTTVQSVSSVFDEEKAEKIKKLKIFSAIFYTFIALGVIISCSVLYVTVSGYFLGLLVIYMLVMVFYSRNMFLGLLEEFGSESQTKALRTVKVYSKWFIVAYGSYIFLSLMHFLVGAGFMLKVPPGELNIYGMFIDFAKIGKFFLQFPTLVYINKLFNNIESKKTQGKTSFVAVNMNQKLSLTNL